MKKWKLLLSTLGAITPLAIATPFIVGCSGKEKQEQAEEKQYRFLVAKGNGCYTVFKQVLDRYDNYFQPHWINLDSGTIIYEKDWEQFVQKANEINVPIVFNS